VSGDFPRTLLAEDFMVYSLSWRQKQGIKTAIPAGRFTGG
jgi:hypothetical protein